MKEKRMDVLIIGGGASGLMAAITAARAGCRVLILEHKEEPGKKILATGNGRCNFTNTVQGSECYRGSTPAFVLQCLELFGAQNAIDFFKEIGIWTKDREGYCYPRSMQAVTIRDGLLQEVRRLHVSVKCDVGIRKIQKENGVFRVQSKEGDFYGKTCILATGGAASPQSGSDGSGYLYAKQLGHSCIEPVPALVPLHANETWLKQVKGVRAEGVVTLLVGGKEIAASGGELQLTDYGISGIPTFQVSRYAARALKENNTVMAMLDFLPEVSEGELIQWLTDRLAEKRNTPEQVLNGLLNQKLAHALTENWRKAANGKQTGAERKADGLRKTARELAAHVKRTRLQITGTGNFKQAQVTAGGIDTREVQAGTMESKLTEGLYFAGEILDVDGICGGYNLQWAWTTGYLSGKHVAEKAKA